MDWAERCFAVATIIGPLFFSGDLAGIVLGTNSFEKSPAVAPGRIASRPRS